jgi:dTDP-4-amino-4,6-dideoxygalactose transaminase
MSSSAATPSRVDRSSAEASAVNAPSIAAPPAFDFLDLRAQFATIRGDVMQAIERVMDSQHFILGQEVRLFEGEIAAMLGARFAIGCASGSDALVLALMALEIGPGDEVITPPFTFAATAGAIARVGATPVFVDIDPATFNMDPAGIEAAMTPRAKAILPVHLFGLSSDLDPILRTARARGIHVIEDAAQAIGARYADRPVGTLGTFGCFSFFPSKNLGGAGDGGLITTEDESLAHRVRLLRAHGSQKKYHHEILGINSRLDALQAAILRVKLGHLERWTRGRQLHAESYRMLFHEAGLEECLPPMPREGFFHAYNQFTIRSRQRDNLREYLRLRGIPAEVYYPVPLHLQPAFAYLGGHAGQFPASEQASREVLSLPVYPELTESRQQTVVRGIADFYAQT